MNVKLCAVILLAWVYICYGSGTPDTFLRLRDTPDSYVGQGLKFVRVNTAANALEFTSASGGGATVFTGLGDVPASYAGSALKAVRVNAAANALEFYTPSVGPIATTDLTDFNAAHGTNGQIPIWDSASTTYIPGDPIVSGPDAVGVAPTKNPVQIGAKFLTTPSTLTNNQVGSLQLDATQNLLVKLQNTSVAVTGTFWQTTQPVSIATMPSTPVTGTFWQATQPVSGTFWQATQPVSGTFWQATQPVSGTVTANQGGTWTVQPGNTANTTAWKVDGSAVTQPVSGTVTANQGGNWTSRIVGNAGGIMDSTIGAATAPANALAISGVYQTTVPALTAGQAVAQQVDTTGSHYVNTTGRSATYRMAVKSFTPVASASSPTFSIQGSASKTVRITRIVVTTSVITGTATPFKSDLILQKYSALTGGTTGSTPTGTLMDSGNSAQTAICLQYSAVPTTATAIGGLTAAEQIQQITSSATVNGITRNEFTFGDKNEQACVLRGTSQYLGISINPLGTTPLMSVTIEWVEDNS
jgi:hypothetical protein